MRHPDPWAREKAIRRREIRAVTETPQARARSGADEATTVEAGHADPVSGEFVSFSLLDVTPIGEGFVLS